MSYSEKYLIKQEMRPHHLAKIAKEAGYMKKLGIDIIIKKDDNTRIIDASSVFELICHMYVGGEIIITASSHLREDMLEESVRKIGKYIGSQVLKAKPRQINLDQYFDYGE